MFVVIVESSKLLQLVLLFLRDDADAAVADIPKGAPSLDDDDDDGRGG